MHSRLHQGPTKRGGKRVFFSVWEIHALTFKWNLIFHFELFFAMTRFPHIFFSFLFFSEFANRDRIHQQHRSWRVFFFSRPSFRANRNLARFHMWRRLFLCHLKIAEGFLFSFFRTKTRPREAFERYSEEKPFFKHQTKKFVPPGERRGEKRNLYMRRKKKLHLPLCNLFSSLLLKLRYVVCVRGAFDGNEEHGLCTMC